MAIKAEELRIGNLVKLIKPFVSKVTLLKIAKELTKPIHHFSMNQYH
jgi:hypothetical protein